MDIRQSASGWNVIEWNPFGDFEWQRESYDPTLPFDGRFQLVRSDDPVKMRVMKQIEENHERIRKDKIANLKSNLFIFIIALIVLTSIFTLVDYLISKYNKFSSHRNYLLGILILSAIVTVSYIVISLNTEIKYDPNGTVLAGLVVGVIYCLFLVWANYSIYARS